MQPRMDERYESAREFFEALEEYNARQPVALARAQATAHPVSSPMTSPAIRSPRCRRRRAHVGARQREDGDEREAPAAGRSVMVGRDRTCSIVLSHPAVSRRHASITLSGRAPVLEDLKSANGTYVNNTRVERAKLKPGDVVRFGADPACSYVLRDH